MKNKITFLLSCFLYLQNSSLACSCIGKKTVLEEFKSADAVFAGTVLSSDEFLVQDKSLPDGYKMYKLKVSILFASIYKGEIVKDTVSIVTGIGGGDCGIHFVVGEKYIIYARYLDKYFEAGNNVKPFLSTNICDRTAIFSEKERNSLCKIADSRW